MVLGTKTGQLVELTESLVLRIFAASKQNQMILPFYKYQGTGNDFVMIDNRNGKFSKNDTNLVKKLCDRKFGIGADGLILLEKAEQVEQDFKMVYFNADGRESSMCGNGGRCIVAFAKHMGVAGDTMEFTAVDGLHKALIDRDGNVGLKMGKVEAVKEGEGYVFLDTGSPHHVIFTENLEGLEVKKEGALVRYSDAYRLRGGTNVNFAEQVDQATFKVRTYERGVEDETLSCGTGVTAVALAAYATGRTKANTVTLEAPGGVLQVSFKSSGATFDDIWLTGPARQVFKGEITC